MIYFIIARYPEAKSYTPPPVTAKDAMLLYSPSSFKIFSAFRIGPWAEKQPLQAAKRGEDYSYGLDFRYVSVDHPATKTPMTTEYGTQK